MEITYQRDLTQSYMIVKDVVYLGFETKMLETNKLHGFLKMKCLQKNGRTEYWYEITGLQTLENYLGTAKLNFEFFRMLYLQLYSILLEAQKFLLSQKKIYLSLDQIYINTKTQQFSVCYFPFIEEKQDILVAFMQEILKVLDHKDTQAVTEIYRIYEVIQQGDFDLKQIKDELMKQGVLKTAEDEAIHSKVLSFTDKEDIAIKKTSKKNQEKEYAEEELKNTSIMTSYYGTGDIPEEKKDGVWQWKNRLFQKIEKYMDISEINKKKNDKKHEKKEIHPMKILFQKKKERHDKSKYEKRITEQDIVYEPDDEAEISNPTILLSDLDTVLGKLEYQGQEEENDFYLTQVPFFIGTKKESVHACLNSKTVSRVHARIDKIGDDYYIEDLNSRNGTWLNGEIITCHTPYLLKKNMKIKFADVNYQFC